jgi:hypothetical protein
MESTTQGLPLNVKLIPLAFIVPDIDTASTDPPAIEK